MKQRTVSNSFIPFHKQISDTSIDTQLTALESHTWQLCTQMYKAWLYGGREVWFSSFTQVSCILLEEAQVNILLQKLTGLPVQRAAGSNTGDTANERVTLERNALARERHRAPEE